MSSNSFSSERVVIIKSLIRAQEFPEEINRLKNLTTLISLKNKQLIPLKILTSSSIEKNKQTKNLLLEKTNRNRMQRENDE
jgi:hypothetical protein